MIIKYRNGRMHRINIAFEDQFKRTLALTKVIRKINEDDVKLTPQEQNDFIENCLPGLKAKEMEAMIRVTGPELAASIRNVISQYRATNRTDKDKNRPR